MRIHLKTGRRFRVLLPSIMTAIQLGLVVVSLIVPREPWVLSYPADSHTQNQSQCSGDNCVSFSPNPPDRGFGRLVKAALLLNFPAVVLGAFLDIAVGLLHVHTNDSALLGFSAIFVPLTWYRVGIWLDNQSSFPIQNQASWNRLKSAWTIIVRVVLWCLFGLLLLASLVERHSQSKGTKFMSSVVALWTGAYLAVGLLGDWRRRAQHSIAVDSPTRT